jgi:hypothetical protein
MSDPRFNSVHLPFPRRHHYRERREALLAARGMVTRTAECAAGCIGHTDDWPRVLHEPRYYLVDQAEREAYALKIGINAIGRRTENDIVLADRTVSRRHCVVLVHMRGSCEVHDTASLNGTFVNGRRVDGAVQIVSGDAINLCNRRFVFLSGADLLAVPQGDSRSATLVE